MKGGDKGALALVGGWAQCLQALKFYDSTARLCKKVCHSMHILVMASGGRRADLGVSQ